MAMRLEAYLANAAMNAIASTKRNEIWSAILYDNDDDVPALMNLFRLTMLAAASNYEIVYFSTLNQSRGRIKMQTTQ